jgi:hypothetical protein
MNHEALARRFTEAIGAKGTTADRLSDETKVPRTTIRALLNDNGNYVLPPRVYLRAHAITVGLALGISAQETGQLFDQGCPVEEVPKLMSSGPRVPAVAVAVAAGLGGIGILAILLSIFR